MDNKEYTKDVFLSWTGCDRELKNQISKYLTEKGYRIYDSDLECRGEYRSNYAMALNESKVYLLILTDGLLENFGSEVKKEVLIANEFEAKGELNIAVLCLSDKFRYGKITPSPKDAMHWFYYSNTRGYSFNDTQKNVEGLIEQSVLERIFEDCKFFIDARDGGQPVISQAPRIKLAVDSKEMGIDGNFFGRINEIADIREKFDGEARIIILHGMGGMGKTQLANKVARLLDGENIFSYVQTVNVSESDTCRDGVIEKWVEEVKFKSSFYLETANISDRVIKYNLRLEELKELPDYCLLVLDNYNALDFKAIEFLKNNLSCRVIVTTRKTFDEKDFEKDKDIEFVNLSKMDECEAYDMFKDTSGRAISKTEFKSVYKLAGGHTYALRIIAKLFIKLSDKSVGEIVDEIKSGMSTDSVNTDREDGSIYEIFAKLYDISNLDGDSVKILLNMSLIADGRIEERTLLQLLNMPNSNAVDILADNCWLIREGEGLYLHPMISQMIFVNQKPGEKDCQPIIDYIIEICDSDLTNSIKSLRGMSEMLYFALYRLSNADGKLCVELWNKFEKINLMLGDVGNVNNKVATLQSKLRAESDKKYLTAYSTKLQLEFQPVAYIDKFQEFVNSLKYHAEDYKRALSYLSVTSWHIVSSSEYKTLLTDLLVKIFDEAQRQNDDLAVLNILIYLFSVDVKKGRSLADKYLRKRKGEGRNGTLIYIELLSMNAKILKRDLYGKSLEMISDIGNEDYGKIIRAALAHPSAIIKSKLLRKRTNKLPDDDSMKDFLRIGYGAADQLVLENKLYIKEYFNAIKTFYELNYDSGLTMQNLSDIVTNFIGIVRQLPPHMRGELANIVSTTYTLSDYSESDINIEKLAQLDIAREINYHLNNKLAVSQSEMLVAVNKKYYAPNSPKVIDSLIQYANTLKLFGEQDKALESYQEAYSILQDNVKESVRLAEVCNAMTSIEGLDATEYKEYRDVALSIYKEKNWDRFNTYYTYAATMLKELKRRADGLCKTYGRDKAIPFVKERYRINLVTEGIDSVICCLEEIACYPQGCRFNMLNSFRDFTAEFSNCRHYIDNRIVKTYVDKSITLFDMISKQRLGRVSLAAKIYKLEKQTLYDMVVNSARTDTASLLKTIDVCLKNPYVSSAVLYNIVSVVMHNEIIESKQSIESIFDVLIGQKGKYRKIMDGQLQYYKDYYAKSVINGSEDENKTNPEFCDIIKNYVNSKKSTLYKYKYEDVRKIRNHKEYFALMFEQVFEELFEKG